MKTSFRRFKVTGFLALLTIPVLLILLSGCAFLHGSAQVSSGHAPTFGLNTSLPLGK